MAKKLVCILAKLGLCTSFLVPMFPIDALAGSGSDFTVGPTKGQVAGVVIGIAATGAVIGVGTCYLVHRNQWLTGCISSRTDGMVLESESDHQTYVLAGILTGIDDGKRVRVSGKKKKLDANGNRTFLVYRAAKDNRPCGGQTTTP